MGTTILLSDAITVMGQLHSSLIPFEDGQDAIVPAKAVREFVDAHAKLLFDRNQIKTHIGDVTAEPVLNSASLGWSKQAPTKQGWYWHWNGDPEASAYPTSVLWSGTSSSCFVSIGQLGIENAIDCKKYGGYWMPLNQPLLPCKI